MGERKVGRSVAAGRAGGAMVVSERCRGVHK